ncbi:MAG TPA: glycosyltransferase [Isosphaeraceae bacterium]|jgi:glycosyltransferase involved in cell wall biosynthesis|nr:glycosyltransferase [Isosphaeraceae bacterium]
MPIRRVLFASHACYLDDSNGAAVASRATMEALARRGSAVEVLCGTRMDIEGEVDPAAWLAARGWAVEESGGGAWEVGARGVRADEPRQLRLTVGGVPIAMHRGPTTRPHEPEDDEREEFLRLVEATLDRFRPDVLVGYGGSRLVAEVFARARARGVATVFTLHNFDYRVTWPFADVDAVLVPSRFAADYYREALGLECTALPYLIDPGRVRAEARDPRYVTFVNPIPEKGLYAFARIADELGRRRPDIPLLVIESRGTEATLAACGLDLRAHGNVHLMAQTSDPRRFWGVTRICLVPSLWWESQGLVAVEAMMNGVPVVASDRGALPETLGRAGIVLPLPDRLTPATRTLPTAEEVGPWVESVIRLWDDAGFHAEHRRRALVEAERWAPEILEHEYVRFFEQLMRPSLVSPDPMTTGWHALPGRGRSGDHALAGRATPPSDGEPGVFSEQTIRPGGAPNVARPPGRAKAVVLVPFLEAIDRDCEAGLRGLEVEGVRVVRAGGQSAVDLARNVLASEALHDGAEAIVFVDADIGFDPLDALRLLARPEPVVCGVYAKKGPRELTSRFADGIDEVHFGGVGGLYPLKYAAAGFLRIRASVLRRMIAELALPLCNADRGRGLWPFFQPLAVPSEDGGHRYLTEDWAFSHRLGLLGIVPLADTTIRLWHFGRYPFGWEDAGAEPSRHPRYTYRISGR